MYTKTTYLTNTEHKELKDLANKLEVSASQLVRKEIDELENVEIAVIAKRNLNSENRVSFTLYDNQFEKIESLSKRFDTTRSAILHYIVQKVLKKYA